MTEHFPLEELMRNAKLDRDGVTNGDAMCLAALERLDRLTSAMERTAVATQQLVMLGENTAEIQDQMRNSLNELRGTLGTFIVAIKSLKKE